ncbi:MAG: hypothetical protein V3T23_05250, partial [Nitrososphaerales archaeon]
GVNLRRLPNSTIPTGGHRLRRCRLRFNHRRSAAGKMAHIAALKVARGPRWWLLVLFAVICSIRTDLPGPSYPAAKTNRG